MSMRECADDYDRVLLILNRDWRVIECRDRIQWILQRRGSPGKSRKDDWRGRSYCRSKEALIRCTCENAGTLDLRTISTLSDLPEWMASITRKLTLTLQENEKKEPALTY